MAEMLSEMLRSSDERKRKRCSLALKPLVAYMQGKMEVLSRRVDTKDS